MGGNTKSEVKVGVIGIGEQGWNNIVPAIAQVSEARIVAVCDLDESRCQLTSALGITNHFTDYLVMLESIEIDAIVVAGPPQLHMEAATRAIEMGISVFVEKPPAVFLRDLVTLSALADKNHSITGVGLNFRYAEPVNMIKSIINAEPSDTPIYMSVKHISSKPLQPLWGLESLNRSLLLSQVIHPLDTMVYFGGEVKDVLCLSCSNGQGTLISANFQFTNGAIGHMLTGSMSPHFENSLELTTKAGQQFVLESLWDLKITDRQKKSKFGNSTRVWESSITPSPLDSGHRRTGYFHELRVFFQCVLQKRAFSPSFTDVVYLYELLDRIEEQLPPDP